MFALFPSTVKIRYGELISGTQGVGRPLRFINVVKRDQR